MSEEAQREYDGALKRMFKERMAKHPPEFQDIAPTEDERCPAKHDGFNCTLKAGHTCDHVAHGMLGYIHHRWDHDGKVSTGNVTEI
jgi:hypothetical protein